MTQTQLAARFEADIPGSNATGRALAVHSKGSGYSFGVVRTCCSLKIVALYLYTEVDPMEMGLAMATHTRNLRRHVTPIPLAACPIRNYQKGSGTCCEYGAERPAAWQRHCLSCHGSQGEQPAYVSQIFHPSVTKFRRIRLCTQLDIFRIFIQPHPQVSPFCHCPGTPSWSLVNSQIPLLQSWQASSSKWSSGIPTCVHGLTTLWERSKRWETRTQCSVSLPTGRQSGSSGWRRGYW